MKKASSKIRKAYNFGGRSNENEKVRGYDYFHSKVCLKNKGSLIKIPDEIKGDDDGLIFYHFLVDSARENEKSYIPRWEKIKEGIQSNDAKWCAALQKMYRDLKDIKQMVDESKSGWLDSIKKGDLESINKSLADFKEAYVPTVSRIVCKLIESSDELDRLSILEEIKKIDAPESGVVATFVVYLKCLVEKEEMRDDLKEEPKEEEQSKGTETKPTEEENKEEGQNEDKQLNEELKENEIEETKKEDTIISTTEPIKDNEETDSKRSEPRMDDLNQREDKKSDELMIDEPIKADSKPQQPRDDDLIGLEEPNDTKGIQDWLEINPLPEKVTEVYIHHPVQENEKKKREREGDNQREDNKRSHINELLSK